jgi:hypothetical protein
VFSLMSNSKPAGRGYPFLSGSSPLTCLVWEAQPVTTLLTVYLSGLFDHASPAITSK